MSKMKDLKAVRVGEKDSPLRSASLVIDESITDKKIGQAVAYIIYSQGGIIIFEIKSGYDYKELMVAGETFVGETLQASNRFHIYKCKLVKGGD